MNPLLLSSIFQIGEKLIERLLPDPAAQAQAKLELLKIQESGDLQRLAMQTDLAKAQVALDTAEVQSGSILGKWRGFLGWTCAGSFAYQFVIQPFMVTMILWVSPSFPVDKLPKLDWQDLGKVLLGMLGIT